jgi:ABC-type multidrug transport system fused ATPase/permease subunit
LEKLSCTRIIVAHRLSTIRQCDRIFVLDGGRIAEEGTFDELNSDDHLFTSLITRQQL